MCILHTLISNQLDRKASWKMSWQTTRNKIYTIVYFGCSQLHSMGYREWAQNMRRVHTSTNLFRSLPEIAPQGILRSLFSVDQDASPNFTPSGSQSNLRSLCLRSLLVSSSLCSLLCCTLTPFHFAIKLRAVLLWYFVFPNQYDMVLDESIDTTSSATIDLTSGCEVDVDREAFIPNTRLNHPDFAVLIWRWRYG